MVIETGYTIYISYTKKYQRKEIVRSVITGGLFFSISSFSLQFNYDVTTDLFFAWLAFCSFYLGEKKLGGKNVENYRPGEYSFDRPVSVYSVDNALVNKRTVTTNSRLRAPTRPALLRFGSPKGPNIPSYKSF